MGNRYQQSIDGAATTYSLDIASDLTQVLGDGTESYLYGIGRIGESGSSGWQYPIPDALGSARQLTDSIASVTLSQSYEPFGAPMKAYGESSSDFGFTGEQDESGGLVYLRARYYDPGIGRFITKDPFPGVLSLPSTLHPYQYALNNPINLVDPSGKIIPALIGALVIGALIGGIGGGISFALNNPGMSLGDMFNSGCFWSSVGIGAAAGAIAGLVGWAAPYWLPLIGINMQAGFGAAIIGGFLTGASASGMGQIATNLFSGQNWSKGLGWAMITGGVAGGIAGGLGHKIRQLASAIEPQVTGNANIVVRNPISGHASEQMAERGITRAMVYKAIEVGTRYFDRAHGRITYTLEGGFASGRTLYVGTNSFTGLVTTVIRRTRFNPNVIFEGLPRWIPLP